MNPLWVLTLVFVIAKLTGYVTWSWIWVFAPLWIPIAVVITFIVSMIGVIGILKIVD